MKNEITSRDDEMCSDQQYIIYKHLSPKEYSAPPLSDADVVRERGVFLCRFIADSGRLYSA